MNADSAWKLSDGEFCAALRQSEDAVLGLFFGLWVSGQIKLRRIRGYRDIGGQQEEAA